MELITNSGTDYEFGHIHLQNVALDELLVGCAPFQKVTENGASVRHQFDKMVFTSAHKDNLGAGPKSSTRSEQRQWHTFCKLVQ